MEIKSKIYLTDSDGEKFMGIGVMWLLRELEEKGSLRSAAGNLGISYSKAYQMVKKLEEKLGMTVIDRKKGGSKHVGSSLTPFGKKFLLLYDRFQMEAKEVLLSPFKDFSDKVNELINDTVEQEKE